MLTPPRIRLAAVRDAAPIATMSRDLIEHGLGWSWTAPRVRQSIADAQTNVVVVPGESGMLRGFAIMRYRDDDAHLLLLAVQPEHARRGIGTALMAWLEKVALTAGVDRISLEARTSNAAARAFYARLGYVESLVQPGYYRGVEASVRMAKDLWLDRPQRA
jgi:[ribosomal protein S18]-alanine N-acetyltransferase